VTVNSDPPTLRARPPARPWDLWNRTLHGTPGLGALLCWVGVFSAAINLLLLAPALFVLQVFSRVLVSRSVETLWLLLSAVVLTLLASAVLDVIRARLLTFAGARLEERLAPRVIDVLLAHRAGSAGEPPANLRDVAMLRAGLAGAPILALMDSPWIVLYLLVIFLMHPLMGLVTLGGMALLLVLVVLSERHTRSTLKQAQGQLGASLRTIEAAAPSRDAWQAHGATRVLMRTWRSLHMPAVLGLQEAADRAGLYQALSRLLRQLLQSCLLAVGAWLVLDHQAAPGVMVGATLVLGRALAPLEALIAGWRPLLDALGALQRLNAHFEPAAASDDVEQLAQGKPASPAPEATHRLRLDNVAFAPLGPHRPVLRGISADLRAGQMLAVIGPSGSGKTVLGRMIVGLARPGLGSVLLDGVELSSWDRTELGRLCGYVGHAAQLFDGTVADNIARGQADVSALEPVRAAARAAGVADLIEQLPQGYLTMLGSAGFPLAHGQARRIALARALYGDPALLVLDEPSSDLDADGEQALVQAIEAACNRGCIVVALTARLRLARLADQWMVLRGGVVARQGSKESVAAWLAGRMPAGQEAQS
jgi:PrtD family type I secretion system ABC transporter